MTTLDQLQHWLWLCEQGLRPEESPAILEQIKILRAEQHQELLDTLKAARIYEHFWAHVRDVRIGTNREIGVCPLPLGDYSKMEPRRPGWFQPMRYDEFIHGRELRESAEGLQ